MNAIGGIMLWVAILRLIGIGGESRSESLSATTNGNNNALFDAISGLPFMVADGLLVRFLCSKFKLELFSHRIDMAVLQNMG